MLNFEIQKQVFSDKKNILQLVALLKAHGVRNIVCCPGSRNTPLLMAFAREERLRKVVVVDERSAGYIAIGIAQQTQQPVAVVCTSGTALLNLAPAAAEAYYAHVPLIVVSADRPSQWIDQNDSQTIRQPLALEQATKWHTSLPSLPSSNDERWHTQRMLNEAWQMATKLPLGTIHINIHISEPIAQTASIEQNDWRSIFHPCTKPRIVAHQATMLAERFASMRRVLVVCGMMPPNAELNSLLCQLANRSNCVVLAEPVSNIHGTGIITEPERALCALTADQEHQLAPELVIYLGEPPHQGVCAQSPLRAMARGRRPQHNRHFHAPRLQHHCRTRGTVFVTRCSQADCFRLLTTLG